MVRIEKYFVAVLQSPSSLSSGFNVAIALMKMCNVSHGWGLMCCNSACIRIGGSGADFLMGLCDKASTPADFRFVMSWLWVFISVIRDGVSMFADEGINDWIWSVFNWIGIAVDPKPVRALHVDSDWLLNIKPRVW